MAEHFCEEHDTKWFKAGKMKRYAHPIKDDEGEDTGEWCNEPKEEKQTKPSIKSDDMSKEEWADKDRIKQDSIERQNAYTGVPNLVACLVANPDDKLAQAAYNYAMSKLGNWSSQGTAPEEPTDEPKATREQIKEILNVYKGKGYTDKSALTIMQLEFDKSSSKELTKEQAGKFIRLLKEGYMLDQTPDEIKPSEIPF